MAFILRKRNLAVVGFVQIYQPLQGTVETLGTSFPVRPNKQPSGFDFGMLELPPANIYWKNAMKCKTREYE
jgi:hypothetical protein